MNGYGYPKNRGGIKEFLTLFIMMIIITAIFVLMNRFTGKKQNKPAGSDSSYAVKDTGSIEGNLPSLDTTLNLEDTTLYILKNNNVSLKVSGRGVLREIKLLNYNSVELKRMPIIKGFLSFFRIKKTKGVVLFKGYGLRNKNFTPDSFYIEEISDSSFSVVGYRDTLFLKKRFLLKKDGFLVKIETNFKNKFIFPGMRPTEPDIKSDISYFRFAYEKEGDLYKYSSRKLKKGKILTFPVDWFALTSKYFTIITESKSYDSLMSYSVNKKIFWEITTGNAQMRFYALPLKEEVLLAYNRGFEALIPRSSGILKPITYILFKLLQLFYRIFRNYGVAIIFFTLTIKLTFFPLTYKSLKSMKKMKSVQGKIEELRKKYKDNPQQLNKEIMALYKTHGVNPLSGCLPLLIQLPIFFALYSVLRNSFEMRGSPFILWIQDLSLRDPYYILPVLMGISSVLQSIITNPDPKQRFMQIFMPLFITVIFLNFPSGLQLYWFIYNVFSLIENFLVHRGGIKWKRVTYQQE